MSTLDLIIQFACMAAGQIAASVVMSLWGMRGIVIVAALGVAVLLVCVLAGCDAPDCAPPQEHADWSNYHAMGFGTFTSLALGTDD